MKRRNGFWRKQMIWTLCVICAMSFCAANAYSQQTCPANSPPQVRVELIRLGTDLVNDRGQQVSRIFGDVGVNNKNVGRFYENPQRKISAKTYRGVLRYRSDHNFVQSSCGVLSRTGDFLLEVANVKGPNGVSRSNILFHPGFLPSHSEGCVLFGGRKRDSQGNLLPLEQDNPLVAIRREFYGTDNPVACPNKEITVKISE